MSSNSSSFTSVDQTTTSYDESHLEFVQNQSIIYRLTQASTEAGHSFWINNTAFREVSRSSCVCIVSVYLVVLLCAVGLIGNFITVVVLRRDSEKHKATNWLLQMLALIDSIFLTFSFIFIAIRTISHTNESLYQWRRLFLFTLPYLWPLFFTAQMLTVWTVLLITVDRYLAACKPMHTRWRSPRRMKLTVLVLFILALVYHIPRFFEMTTSNDPRICAGAEYCIKYSELEKNVYYQIIYRSGATIVFRSVGPILILIVLNVRISWRLRSLSKRRRHMTQHSKSEQNMTIMLVVVATVFIICQLPATCINLVSPTARLFPFIDIDQEAFFCAIHLCNALLVLNSSINFLIYCIIWKRFKKICNKMIRCGEYGHVEHK